jgi:[acyl-carrier-protein] S-malonyltransferase
MMAETTANRIAFVFAGQGSQKPGMGRDLYDAYPTYRSAFDAMDEGGRIRALCFDASMEELSDTRNTQPAMVAMELAISALLQNEGIRPAQCAGLSLGEYAALGCAGVFSPRQAVELVTFRGQAMADAVQGRACGMAAILGLEGDAVRAVCREATEAGEGVVEAANFNCPGQVVVSGDAAAVERASEAAKHAGAKRCMPLPVSGAFHTSLMRSAGDALRARFAGEPFAAMDVPVVFNTTGCTLGAGQTIPELLERQVQSSVLFDDSIRHMAASGIDTVIEIGPGRTLSKLVRKIDGDLRVLNVEDVASFEKTLAACKEDVHA